MTVRRDKRLTRDDWLAAGAEILAMRGAEALKAEPMARHMATTKGSFYWHFKDVPDFQAQLLSRWEAGATPGPASAAQGGAVARLRALAQALAEAAQEGAEPAIRAWAVSHPPARAAVGRADAARRAALVALLREIDISNPEMARILHAAALGMAALGEDAPGECAATMGSLVDLVLALR